MIVDLIRHGEPVGGKKYRGQLDDPLSDKGWRQMRQAIEGHQPWDAIYSSDLSRCAEFANEVATHLNLPLSLHAEFREIGFGEWEGKTAAQLQAEDEETLFRFWSDPLNNRPPGAEALLDFQSRIVSAWTEVISQNQYEHVLVVGHAGMMRMIISHVLRMPIDAMFRIDVPNAGITRIRIDGEGEQQLPRLVFHAGNLA